MAVKPLSSVERHPPFVSDDMTTRSPPYDFEGVTLRYFPLKANKNTLRMFCDDYLNLAPELLYFKPASASVILIVVNYGRMSQQLGNLGWLSQNELLFAVPLEWYRLEEGKLVFHDLATVAPFIFVDNDSSQSTGREILGWPKVQGWFSRDVDAWAKHPRNRREVLTLSTSVFEKLYQSQTSHDRELLVIEENPTPTITQLPLDFGGLLNPLASVPKALAGLSDLTMQAVGTTMEMLTGTRGDSSHGPLSRLAQMARAQDLLGLRLHGNTINLKQMRDANDPEVACYQAITNAKMEVAKFHRGGMLGDAALLQGDTSGGFRIRVNRYESQPIIEALGLEVEDEQTAGARKASYLRPTLPFWQEMDFRYVQSKNLCWRTRDLDWRNAEVETVAETHAEKIAPHSFNTTGPAGLQVATGPFQFANATFRILPLLADPAKLNTLVKKGLHNGVANFEAFGSYVYVIVASYGAMHSQSNDLGDWAGKTVDFAIPVRCSGLDGELLTTGYYCPFMFNNTTIAATTGREVYGWAVNEAQIMSPPSTWLDEEGPFAELTPLLDLKAEVMPAVGVGQKSDWRTLLEIDQGVTHREKMNWNAVADEWGSALKADVSRMAAMPEEEVINLRALSLEILGNQAALNQFSLKQFRDAEYPDRACYQALVRRQSHIRQLTDVREIEERMLVKIHYYPTHPIVDALGLVCQGSDLSDQGRVDYLQPSRPFYMHADLDVALPENLGWRSLEGAWLTPEKSADYYFKRSESAGSQTSVGPDLVHLLDEGETALNPLPFTGNGLGSHRLQFICKTWKEASAAQTSLRLDRSTAAKAILSKELEPQMAVHATLSRAWANTQKQNGRAELPNFVIRRDSVGAASAELFPANESVPNSTVDYWSPPIKSLPERS